MNQSPKEDVQEPDSADEEPSNGNVVPLKPRLRPTPDRTTEWPPADGNDPGPSAA